MKLVAKKRRTKYKDTDSWLNAVYRNNKAEIDNALKAFKNPRSVFKRQVYEQIEEGKKPDKALQIVNNSVAFTPVGERLGKNAMKALKSDKEAYKQFREMTKEKGKYTKIDMNKLEWDKYQKVYIYDGQYKISFKNSPYQVIIEEI